MPTYRLWHGGSNTAPYDTWAKAATSFATAVAACTVSEDTILVHKGHQEDLDADAAYSFSYNTRVICVDKDNSDALAEMDGTTGYIGHQTLNRYISIAVTNVTTYMRGVAFVVSGSTADFLRICYGDNSEATYEKCKFFLNSTNSNTYFYLSGINSTMQTAVRMRDCTVSFGHASQRFYVDGASEIDGLILAGTALSQCFRGSNYNGSTLSIINSDLSLITGDLFGDFTTCALRGTLANCKLGTGVNVLASQSAGLSGAEVTLFNCAAGDQHYHIGHFNARGQTIVDTGIYANDGAQYDGTNRCSWKITTTSLCTFFQPYISPFIERYHDGTSAITPSLEILRDGSTTPYTDEQVWAEFGYQGNSGSPLGSKVRDRMTPLGTPANQDAGVGLSGWTGESGSAWSGKLVAPSLTPAEIGHLRARVVVGAPSITVYVDPTIRGT